MEPLPYTASPSSLTTSTSVPTRRAYRMEASLNAHILRAVELRTSELIRSHPGMLQMGDVPVGLIGDMEIKGLPTVRGQALRRSASTVGW